MIGSIAMCVMTTTGMGQHLLLLSANEFSGYLRVLPPFLLLISPMAFSRPRLQLNSNL